LREFILARTNIPAEIDLELPIAAASPALKFTVFDFQGLKLFLDQKFLKIPTIKVLII